MDVGLKGAAAAQVPAETNVYLAANTQAAMTECTIPHADRGVQALTKQAMQTPALRQPAVAALQQSVSSGSYQADASRTANAISQES